MSGKTYRRVSALVIITVASGCDNVDWGGAEVRLVEPPSRTPDTTAVQDTTPPEPDLGLPEGPVLYVATREGDRVTLVPVAEIRADSLLPVSTRDDEAYRTAFVREHLQPGAEFILFANAVRVGRVRPDEVETDDSFCTPRPAASGIAEVVPTAATAERFLALSAEEAASRPYGDFETPEDTYAQREASVRFEIDLLRRIGARFPSGQVVDHRVEIRSLRLGPTGPDAFTATFVNLDAARIEPADSSAYASFLVGVEATDDTYRSVYEWHRRVGSEGKGVPLLWGYLDWDGDGENEILLEVLGAETRWTAAVARRGAQWERVFQDPCGTLSAEADGS